MTDTGYNDVERAMDAEYCAAACAHYNICPIVLDQGDGDNGSQGEASEDGNGSQGEASEDGNSSNSNEKPAGITIGKTKIKRLKSPKGRRVKVSFKSNGDSSGYQVNFALNKTFSKANKYRNTKN